MMCKRNAKKAPGVDGGMPLLSALGCPPSAHRYANTQSPRRRYRNYLGGVAGCTNLAWWDTLPPSSAEPGKHRTRRLWTMPALKCS